MRYELTDHEWAVIRIMLPNMPRGVPRGRPACPKRHLLGVAIWRTVADLLLQSLRALATG